MDVSISLSHNSIIIIMKAIKIVLPHTIIMIWDTRVKPERLYHMVIPYIVVLRVTQNDYLE